MTDYLEQFTTYLSATDVARETVRGYTADVRTFDAFCRERGIGLEAAQPDDVSAWVTSAEADSTKYRRSVSLRTFFGWMVDRGYVVKSPSFGPHPKRPIAVSEAVDIEQVRAFLESASAESDRDARALLTAALIIETGAKLGEVAALDFDDIDETACEVTLGRDGPKERAIPYGHLTERHLTEWRRADILDSDARQDFSSLLLTSRGERPSERTMVLDLQRLADPSGIEGINATRLLNAAHLEFRAALGYDEAMRVLGVSDSTFQRHRHDG